jgi:lipopolysaccharide/colanic/teichoic acid biosynthesis glycosyltransferase
VLDGPSNGRCGGVPFSESTTEQTPRLLWRMLRVVGALGKRAVDLALALVLLVILLPVIVGIACAIKVESRGPIFYRATRVGRFGKPLAVLKFRKMFDGARGSALTISRDDRFTRVGRFLTEYRLDEIPQLWNVLRGQMSLVGPRPEDRKFVEAYAREFAPILEVRPGITGLTQLAFAHEGRLLATDDRERDYRDRLLPRKIEVDCLYVQRRSLVMDLRIIAWTGVAVALGRDVAVHRDTGRLGVRRRPAEETAVATVGNNNHHQRREEAVEAPPVLS